MCKDVGAWRVCVCVCGIGAYKNFVFSNKFISSPGVCIKKDLCVCVCVNHKVYLKHTMAIIQPRANIIKAL